MPEISNNPSCPCCGAAVDPLRVLTDPAQGLVAFGGQSVRLPSLEFCFFEALRQSYPRVLSKEAMFDKVYGARPECDWPEPKIIDVMICKMRPKLAPLGLIISTHWGVGYSITFADPEALDAIKDEGIRSDRNPKQWDASNDGMIVDLHERGFALSEIARRTGVGYMAASRAMQRLGLTRTGQTTAKAGA
ncbi:winged helix-turn-helix domain-containing protein [Mesorhizobium sp. BR1-1-16]|uniref:winged helix-turn-helix domain-containing protein n=1 Tax=Mesorhizobium sp. BR1-1-16 TaxID=2876653 RepID=UPI001CC9F42E|nr:winged helix-turn-helix domain-containing protein [Mesorhizobium sp. BR1-1-16]MBZ9939167.1 winged helix-turn-helix domain-containing protein [Mesorhizobium sp. BR1-1-16]